MEDQSKDSEQPFGKLVEVVFIRHAESEENVKVRHCCEAIQAIKHFTLPTLSQIQCITSLLFQYITYDLDAKVTMLGKRQLKDMKLMLQQEKFWTTEDICVYSPMERTAHTCKELVPNDMKCEVLTDLREFSPLEHLLSSHKTVRVKSFESDFAV